MSEFRGLNKYTKPTKRSLPLWKVLFGVAVIGTVIWVVFK